MNDIDQALAHHQAGRLNEAEVRYREILAREPENVDALMLLGVLNTQQGDAQAALGLLEQAIRIRPDAAHFHNNRGEALRVLGRLAEAIAAYEQAVALSPGYADAYLNLGNAHYARGETSAAIDAFRHASVLLPDDAEAHNNLAIALAEEGAFREAVAHFQRALALKPNCPDIYYNLGNALLAEDQPSEALAIYQQALANGYVSTKIYNNIGNAFCTLGKPEDASAAYRQALALDWDFAEGHNNLGVVLDDQGKLAEALAAFERAVALKPDYAEAHENRSMTLLRMGNLEAGWPEYEWRLMVRRYQQLQRAPDFSQPRWDGSHFRRQSLLIYTEQGLGDTIQFIRYLPLVQGRGGKVLLACQANLRRLFCSFAGVDVLPGDTEQLQSPPVDLQVPLLSLPHIFRTELETIPNEVPYLRVPSPLLNAWRKRVDPTTHNVGIVWAGNPHPSETRNPYRKRSCDLYDFAPLLQVSGVTLYGLQKDVKTAQTATSAGNMHLVDYSSEFTDFAETAALIANLDLVIAVDTAVAHLAGALGRPVWTLLPYAADWRWLMEREDTPWYPTMRLFRQQKPGDWQAVIMRIAAELQSFFAT